MERGREREKGAQKNFIPGLWVSWHPEISLIQFILKDSQIKPCLEKGAPPDGGDTTLRMKEELGIWGMSEEGSLRRALQQAGAL